LTFQVFQAVVDLLPSEPVVQSFVADFESGIWQGLRSVFNNPSIKVQEVGLQVFKQ
jgi:hypothetical protein